MKESLVVSDIETLKGCIDIGFWAPKTDEWWEFEISPYRNDLYAFVKFYTELSYEYIVGFNYVGFDAVILQWVVNNYEQWADKTGQEIAELIYAYTQKHIDNQKYGIFPEFREWDFPNKIIDVYTILGLNNRQRATSLKKCEFQLDMPSVEEMPIHHSRDCLTVEEIEQIKSYRRVDVKATYEVYKLAIGDSQHPVYKENNQLELREGIESEFNIRCRNMSDIDIGDAIVKQAYAKAKGIELKDVPKNGTFRKNIYLRYCIPKWVEFKTDELQDLLKITKSKILGQSDKYENKFTFKGREYVQALGGLHSVNKDEVFEATEDILIEDDDVASYYPKQIINNQYFPKHLGKELLVVYQQLYEKRMELKPRAKKEKRIKGIVAALKLSLNSVFGKMGMPDSWLYDKQCMLSVTLSGQFALLMLIEEFEMNGIRVISANSDGVTTMFNKNLLEKKQEIVKKWQEVANLEIETVRFKKFMYASVNDYIAFPMEGEIKRKGCFVIDPEIWQDKSERILALAWEEYFVNKKDPIQFIENHENVFDFCIRAIAKGQSHLEEQIGAEIKIHKKLVRYYISERSNSLFYKRGLNTKGNPMNVIVRAENELGKQYLQYFNQWSEQSNYHLDKKQYILSCLKMIDRLEKTKKAKKWIEKHLPTSQSALF